MWTDATIIDEEVLREDRYGEGSSNFLREVEVLVTGAKDAAAAEREADWRARFEADGEVQHVSHVRTEGPLSKGEFLVTLTVEALRYW